MYDYFERQEGVTLLRCMAHVRRKLNEAQNSHPKLVAEALQYIRLLYELEANLREQQASPEVVVVQRQAKALPIIDVMEAWMRKAADSCIPGDLLGKALDYAYKL